MLDYLNSVFLLFTVKADVLLSNHELIVSIYNQHHVSIVLHISSNVVLFFRNGIFFSVYIRFVNINSLDE